MSLLISSADSYGYKKIAEDDTAAIIFAYQNIGEDHSPETNIRIEQFEAHITELTNGQYNILPLTDIVEAHKNKTSLPPHSVAITFDGGYKSAFENGIPKLLKANIPFTVFVAPAQLDQKTRRYINWSDLKPLAKNSKVTFGLHPAHYERLYNKDKLKIEQSIQRAKSLMKDRIKRTPVLFAYPFGEYNNAYKAIIQQSGFDAAFGLQSSVMHVGSDSYALPRFTMTENYAGFSRFQLIANTMPLPVRDTTPVDPMLTTTKPSFGFTLSEALQDQSKQMSCFLSDIGRLQSEKIGEGRFEFLVEGPINTKRVRMNCTLPFTTDTGEKRWRWYGQLYIVNKTEKDGDMYLSSPLP